MKTTFHRLLVVALLISSRPGSAAEDKEKKEPPKLVLTEDEKAMVELTNKEREKLGLPALKINLTLCKVARGHSDNMAKQEKLEHELDGKKPGERTTEGGYIWEVYGENVARGNKAFTVPLLIEGFMKSPVHRENIVQKEFTEIGVGIGSTKKGERYFTQLFATPQK